MAKNFSAYSKEVLKRFTSPKNYGEIKNPDGKGKVGNPKCGDLMEVYLRIENGKIKDIKFQTFGCVAAIAASDVLCELAKGKTIQEAKKINNKTILKKLKGLPLIKLHCSVLGEEALKAAIEDYEKKKTSK
jgi:nitrogen fixation NifU-like protein